MEETWKDIRGYENYEVSNFGQVRNKQTMKLRKPQENNSGYICIILYKGGKLKHFCIHRLVAEAFIPNPNMLPEVNHKDEDKKNNCVNNLEFCTASYNKNFGTRNQKVSKKVSKPVICVETGQIFASAMDAQREKGYSHSNISCACNGKYKTAYGYQWQFV